MFCIIGNCFSQVEPVKDESLDEKDKTKIQTMKNDPWISEFKVIKFSKNIDELPPLFEIGFPSKIKNNKITIIDNDSPITDKHIKGKFHEESEGDIIELMNAGYGTFGYAILDGEYYTIEALDLYRSVVLKHDESKYPVGSNCESNFGPSKRTGLVKVEKRTGPNTENCRVKVLVLYTQAALNSVSNIISTAYTGLAQTNTAFANSGINGRVTGGMAMFLNENNLANALSTVPENCARDLSSDPYILNLRNLHKADIVILLHVYINAAANGSVAFDGGEFKFADPLYPVAEMKVKYATSARFTFAHEVGHLFNARHTNDDDALPGRAFTISDEDDDEIQTLMGNEFSGEGRILHFSNPSITFNNIATGIIDNNDNSKNINDKFCELATWQNSFELNLSTPSSSQPGYYTSVMASIGVDIYPCTLEWYADPYPYGNTLVEVDNITNTSGGANYNFYFPSIPINSYYYITGKLIPQSPYGGVNTTISIYYGSSYKVLFQS